MLYVEDQERVRSAILRAIAHHAPGLRWLLASNLEEALAALDAAPDRLLLDLCLGPPPNTDGLLVLAEARTRGIRAPAYVLSGNLDYRTMCEAQDLGALVLDKVLLDASDLARRLSAEPPGEQVSPRPEDYRNIAKILAQKTGTLREHIGAIEDACIDEAREVHDGSKTAVARVLGVSRRWLQRKMDE